LTSGALKFPATPIASSDANTLDTYEQGTFTPYFSDSSGGVGSGQTYHYQFGNYVKIGAVCWFQLRCSLNDNLGGLSGAVYIKNLPFTSLNQTNNMQALAVGQGSGWSVTAGESGAAWIDYNTTLITLFLWDGGLGTSAMQYTELTSDGGISVSGGYMCTS